MSKLIFLDIDSTLLSHEIGIPESAYEAIKLAKKKGHKIFINTGRVRSGIGEDFNIFPLDGIVAAAGAYIEVGDKLIYENYLSEDQVNKIEDTLKSKGIAYALEGVDHVYFDELALGYFAKRRQEFEEIAAEMDEHDPLSVLKFISPIHKVKKVEDYHKDKTRINKFLVLSEEEGLIDSLREDLDEDLFLISYGFMGEIIIDGINKASGIDKVLDYLGASLEDTIAFGDSLNDLEMIQHANIGVVMGNGAEELKKEADFIADHINDDGLYKAFKELDLI